VNKQDHELIMEFVKTFIFNQLHKVIIEYFCKIIKIKGQIQTIFMKLFPDYDTIVSKFIFNMIKYAIIELVR